MAVVVLTALNATMVAAVPFQVGDVFVGVGTGFIKHFNSSGSLIETLNTNTTCAEQLGMAFDAAGNLYATSSFGTCFGAGKVVKFNNTGGLIGPFGSNYSDSTESITIDATQNVYVGQPDGTKQILKFDSAGTLLASFSPATGPRGTDWIDIAADQSTMFYTSEGSAVKRYNVSSSTQLADFATGLSGPCYALRIRTNGEVMVACSNQAYRLNATGGVVQTYPKNASETSFLFALNLDPDGQHFWTASYSTGIVYKYNITSGAQVFSFDANKLGYAVSGLAIFGEPTVGQPPEVAGRMTGGGSVFNGTMRVTHGFQLSCNASMVPNKLQVNWGKGNRFHLESLTTASCTDNPAIVPNPPAAGFDTYVGNGTGRYNGVPGATTHWIFSDAGEPGSSDSATIHVWDAGGSLVLSVSGNLDRGNHQAHNQ